MTEEDTFNKLKRTPLSDMLEIIKNEKHLSPLRNIGIGLGVALEQSSVYINLMRQQRYLEILNEHGWSWDDFILEMERDTILSHVKYFNENLKFPADLLEHTKRFFPNMKFTEAKIELE